jgi:hypothetical protein
VSFALPIAAGTLAAVAAGLAALAVGAYVLRMRRRRFEVPFSTLWQRVLREKETTSLWRRLRRLLSLLLQLAILAFLLLAAADPRIGDADDAARNVVVIVDASASMKARDAGDDGDEPRIDAAKRRAHDLVASLGAGDAAMIVRMDGRTSPLSRFETDKVALHAAVDALAATDTPADLRRALAAAADALRDRRDPLIVLIGDGAYPAEALAAAVWEPLPPTADFADKRLAAIDLSGIDVRFLPIGATGENVGIAAFNVRRYVTNKLAYEVLLELQNFGEQPASTKLTLYDGPTAIDVQTFALAAGERTRKIVPNLSGGESHQLRAVLEPAAADGAAEPPPRDAFALDDEAHALLPERRRQTILLVTRDNLYLEGAMLVYDNIQIDKLTPDGYDAAVAKPGALPPYDVVVFDDHTPAALPDAGHLLYFGPRGPHSPFPVAGELDRPRITETAAEHPVMRFVVMTDVNFDRGAVFKLAPERGDVALARSIRSPIIAARSERGRKVVAVGFSLAGTDLTLRVAFPLFLVNALDWFAGDEGELITTYRTGQRLRVPVDAGDDAAEVTVRTPSGGQTRAPLTDGRAVFYAAEVGVHRLTVVGAGSGAGAGLELAANLADPAESTIRPAAALALGGRELAAPDAFELSARRSIWLYLALVALLLLGVEWLTYNRRITV